MPAFDPNLVLSGNPRVRAANTYQAVLDYVQARLTSGDYTTFLTDLGTAGLPTSSDDILNLPDAARLIDGVSTLAFHFVTASGRPINPDPLSTLPQSVAGLRVLGDLAAQAAMFNALTCASLSVTGAMSTGALSVAGSAAVGGNLTVSGKMLVGAGAPDPGTSGLSAAGTLSGTLLQFSATTDPNTADPGTLCEDANGDLWYVDLSGKLHSLIRPMHDTDWLAVNPLHACLGLAGTTAPTPGSTPDIHDPGAPPLTIVQEVGLLRGALRVVAWLRCDTSLVDGGAATSTYYYFPVFPFGTAATQQGVLTYITPGGQLSIIVGANLVPGQAGITQTATPSPEIRVMIWTY